MSKNVFDLEVKVKAINEVGAEPEYLYTSTCYTSTCYTGQQMCGYTYTTGC